MRVRVSGKKILINIILIHIIWHRWEGVAIDCIINIDIPWSFFVNVRNFNALSVVSFPPKSYIILLWE